MKSFSNKYIFIYSTALVAIVAVVLTVVAVSLKPLQVRNEQIETKQKILNAVGIKSTVNDAEALYANNIREVNLLERDSLPAYLYKDNCIIPMRGVGLWGPIWGYIAFDSEWKVIGAVFDHKGETPGLGGEIATEEFASRFIGKKIVDDDFNFIPIILKKNADKSSPYEIDAISGGTMTSNGVTEMLRNCLSKYSECFGKRSGGE